MPPVATVENVIGAPAGAGSGLLADTDVMRGGGPVMSKEPKLPAPSYAVEEPLLRIQTWSAYWPTSPAVGVQLYVLAVL